MHARVRHMRTPRQDARAVGMVRRIRDAHVRRLAGKSAEERIAFYRRESGKALAEARAVKAARSRVAE